jgi:hypothetical protein
MYFQIFARNPASEAAPSRALSDAAKIGRSCPLEMPRH